MPTKKIFAMGFRFRTELDSINSVIQKLNEDHTASFVFFKGLDEQTEKMIKLAQEKGIPNRVFELTLDAKTEESILAVQKQFKNAFRDASAHGRLNESSFTEEEIWKHLSPENISVALRHYELSKRLFDMDTPDVLIVLGDQTLLDRFLCLAAQSRGIKIVGIPTYHLQLSVFLGKCSQYFESSVVDQWAVLNKTFKEVLIQAGIKPHQVTVTGLPKFNSLATTGPSIATSEEILKNLGIRKTYTGIFLLALADPPWNRVVFNWMTTAMKEFPDKLLIVRPHPFEKYELFYKIPMPENMIVDRECELHDLLQASGLLIAGLYSTPYEAILMDKPVIALNPLSQVSSYVFVEQGAAIEVSKPQDIASTIRTILSDSEVKETLRVGRRKILENYSVERDINSTDLIKNLLEKM